MPKVPKAESTHYAQAAFGCINYRFATYCELLDLLFSNSQNVPALYRVEMTNYNQNYQIIISKSSIFAV